MVHTRLISAAVCAAACCSFALTANAADQKKAAAPATAPAAAPAGQAAAPAGQMPDMTKSGPMTRVPKNEKADKKELDAFFKAMKDADKKGDLAAEADMMDFPVMMITDDAKGNFVSKEVNRDDWMNMMKPFAEHMKDMKDMKMDMKGTCYMMSDDLASCEGQNTMSMGKVHGKWNSQMLMVRKDGKWKTKSMVEAGWGDMSGPTAQK